jgi:hypothetical protein
VRRRRDLRTSKIAKLEAEIQALAAPDVIELAFAAEEAATSYKDQRAAAHSADRWHGTASAQAASRPRPVQMAAS